MEETTLGATILSQLARNEYACLVCTDPVPVDGPVWACGSCHRVFDLQCVSDWAKADMKKSKVGQWRCPSCNVFSSKLPAKYRCWCGRETNPRPNPLEPHSCGAVCSARIKGCSHGCEFTCHPGPHQAKCTQMGPETTCKCGKHTKQTMCSLTKRNWSCGEVCDDTLACTKHKCTKRCHKGVCGECTAKELDQCYCGNIKDFQIKCSDRNPFLSVNAKGEKWVGSFQCDKQCSEMLECGNHKCNQSCHPQSVSSHQCPLSPQNVTTCNCGQTPLKDLGVVRKDCVDPIPSCDKSCGKLLPCGHKCYFGCHSGPCSPCYQPVTVNCSCESHSYSLACGLSMEEGYMPQCNQKCSILKSCRRHACKLKCCPDRPKGLTREHDIRKRIRRNELTPAQASQITLENIEPSHVCLENCGKLLNCGKHTCEAICHAGNCAPCIQSEFEDKVCNCGKTILHAPFRCGTQLPQCDNVCVRKSACGHPMEWHKCHPDDKPCPPCRTLCVRKCRCHRENSVANVLCSLDQQHVSCMMKCELQLSCGVEGHTCQKECHTKGDCVKQCTEQCDGARDCGHRCKLPCHAKAGARDKCPENYKCQELVQVNCQCGEHHVTVQCWIAQELHKKKERDDLEAETKKAEQEQEKIDEDVAIQSETIEPVASNSTPEEESTSEELSSSAMEPSSSNTSEEQPLESLPINAYLPCNNQCGQKRRARLMFIALHPQNTNSDIIFQYKQAEELYSSFILQVSKAQPKWALSIENILRNITLPVVIRQWGITDPEEEEKNKKSNSNNPSVSHLSAGERVLWKKQQVQKSAVESITSLLPSHHFSPMKSIQRRFIHEMAQSWGIKSQAQDPEPKRSVLVKATHQSHLPNVDLTQALAIYEKYLVVKAEQDKIDAELAAQQLALHKLRLEEEAKFAKALELKRLEAEKKIKQQESKLWNAILVQDTSSFVSLEEVSNELSDIYKDSTLEASVHAVSDGIWVVSFDLDPRHDEDDAKLLAQNVIQWAGEVENRVREKGWGQQCFVCIIDDEGVVSEMRDWSNDDCDQEHEVVDIDVLAEEEEEKEEQGEQEKEEKEKEEEEEKA